MGVGRGKADGCVGSRGRARSGSPRFACWSYLLLGLLLSGQLCPLGAGDSGDRVGVSPLVREKRFVGVVYRL